MQFNTSNSTSLAKYIAPVVSWSIPLINIELFWKTQLAIKLYHKFIKKLIYFMKTFGVYEVDFKFVTTDKSSIILIP